MTVCDNIPFYEEVVMDRMPKTQCEKVTFLENAQTTRIINMGEFQELVELCSETDETFIQLNTEPQE